MIIKKVAFVSVVFSMFGLILAGCASGDPSLAVGGSSPYYADAAADSTKIAAQAFIRETEGARYEKIIQITAEAGHAQATQDERNSQATSMAWSATVTADSVNSTATASWSSTQDARAYEATQAAARITQRAAEVVARQTEQAALYAEEQNRLSLERQRTINTLQAFAGYIVGLVILLVSVYIIWSRFRMRVIPREVSGASPFLILDGKLIDPGLAPTVVTDPGRMLPSVSSERLAQVKENAQKIDAIYAMKSGEKSSSPASSFSAANVLSSWDGPRVDVVEPESVSSWIEEVNVKLLDSGAE